MTPESSLRPPFRLLLLGRIAVEDAEGRPVRSVMAQPKRLALLAFLALHGEGSGVRRETLIAHLWPELDGERARGALRKALHFLRQSLGEEVLPPRGGDTLTLTPGMVETDVVAFRAALEGGELAHAVELFQGELLAGLSVSDAPEFDRWLDGERDRLRALARDAAWSLADAAFAAGDREGARRWARKAHSLAPLSDESVRRLMRRLTELGDRTAALRSHDTFSEALRRELGVEPDPETTALAAELRGMGGTHPPLPVPAVGAPPAASFPQGDGMPAAPSHPVRRRRLPAHPLLLLLLLILIPLGLGVGWMAATRSAGPAPGGVDPNRIAIFPLQASVPAELAYLSDGMAVLLANGLDGAGSLTVAGPLPELVSGGRGGDLLAHARQEARRRGAGLLALGTVVGSGDRLQVEVALYESTGASPPRARVEADGGEGELLEISDRLVARILAAHLQGRGARLAGTAALTSPSIPALKHYLQGESALRVGQFDQAVAHFEAAVAEDSTFALAHYQLSSAANWAGRMELVAPARARAVAHRERLSGRARLLVEALEATNRGTEEGVRHYRTILDRYPDDADAALELAELLFHRGPFRGRPILESTAAFERVLGLRGDDLNSLLHLARLKAVARDAPALDSLTRRLLTLAPEGDQAPEVLLLRVLGLGEAEAEEGALAARGRIGDQRLLEALWRTASYTGNPQGVVDPARTLLRGTDSPDGEVAVRLLLAHALAATGAYREAEGELEAMGEIYPALALRTRALFTLLPDFRIPPEEAAELLIHLREGAAVGPTGQSIFRGAPLGDGPDPGFDDFYLGLFALQAGEVERAAGHRAALRSRIDGGDPSLDLAKAHAILGIRVAMARGEPQAALTPASAVAERYRSGVTSATPLLPRAAFRTEYAALLSALGRRDEALAWYATLPEDLGFDLIFLGAARRAHLAPVGEFADPSPEGP